MTDATLAQKFLAFVAEANAHYGFHLERLGYASDFRAVEPELIRLLGPDWREKKKCGWANMSALVEKYGGKGERLGYAWCSHFVHCSGVAGEFLDRTGPTDGLIDAAIVRIYGSYIESTSSFIEFTWGRIVTSDGELCKQDFEDVHRSWIKGRGPCRARAEGS